MITRIEIKNFQSHKHTVLDLVPGVNILTGSSDSGKSSVIRALKWVLENRPRGFDFRADFADKNETTSAMVAFTDGSSILREKSETKNSYTIFTPEGEKIVAEALRADVPDEVRQVSRMSEVNVQSQHDPYFLIQSTPGERAKKLNEVAGLDTIDAVVKRSNSIVSSIKSDIDKRNKQIKEHEKSISEYAFLDKAEPLIIELNSLSQELSTKVTRMNGLSNILVDIKGAVTNIEAYKAWLSVEAPYNELVHTMEKWQEVKSKLSALKRDLGLVNKAREDIKNTKAWLSVEAPYNELKALIERRDELDKKAELIDKVLILIMSTKANASEAQKFVNTKTEIYKAIITENGICPACGQKITMEHAEGMCKCL